MILVSIAIAGFVISNIKNGIISKVEAQPAGGNVLFAWERNGNVITLFAFRNGSNYTWNFGDDGYAYGKIVTHKCDNEGTYNVSLTIERRKN